jgi:hypothetical protein
VLRGLIAAAAAAVSGVASDEISRARLAKRGRAWQSRGLGLAPGTTPPLVDEPRDDR